jgi:hypothetical protein
MAIKKSVRLTMPTIKTLNNISDIGSGDINFSGSINSLAEKFEVLMADNLPELSEAKIFAFRCAYNGYMPHPDPKVEASTLHWAISEGYQYDEQIKMELDDAEVDIHEFIAEIKAWSLSQKLAVIYMAKSFWRSGPTIV